MTGWETVEPSRIAVAGDWHGNQYHAARAIRYAAEQGAEAILHVGDFGYDFHPKFLGRVERVLRETRLPLGFVGGNHDSYDYLDPREAERGVTAIPLRDRLYYLPRTYRWTWSGVSFLALGGAHSVDRPWRTPSREWWARETITIGEAVTAANGGHADIMICHDVPDGVRIPSIEGNPIGFPDAELAAAQRHRELLARVVDEVRPQHLFAGHYHCRLDAPLIGRDYRTEVHILDMDDRSIADNVMLLNLR
ncbi:metallophosphoesterase family protein [Nocardia thailandica]|uniref:metallophosphoesterase family protein n=1 Tax=Nocardia thailandica TaxID=257275 RepID=UPI0002FD019B|nr:metallophosphoesterase [Nocardia thailandica]